MLLTLAALTVACASPQTCVLGAPFDDVEAAIVAFIDGAVTEVLVSSVGVSSQPIAAALDAKAKSGVPVTLLLDFNRSESGVVRDLVAANRVEVLHVPSLRGGGPQMHIKSIVVDRARAVLGTGNFTTLAMSASVESFIMTSEPAVVGPLVAELGRLRRRTQLACRMFNRSVGGCPGHPGEWESAFEHFARQGTFRSRDLRPGARCNELLRGAAVVETWPVDFSVSNLLADCVANRSFLALQAELRESVAPPQRGAPLVWLSSRAIDVEHVLLEEIADPDTIGIVGSISRLHRTPLVQALGRAAVRGVDVRLLTGDLQHHDAGGGEAAVRLEELLPPPFAVRVRDGLLIPGALWHNKVVIFVHRAKPSRAVLSSANWSSQALVRSDELFVEVNDPHVVAALLSGARRERSLLRELGVVLPPLPANIERAMPPLDRPRLVLRTCSALEQVHVDGRAHRLRREGACAVTSVQVAQGAHEVIAGDHHLTVDVSRDVHIVDLVP